MYFDLLGLGMITYRDSTARVLHNVPFALCLLLPLSSISMVSRGAGRVVVAGGGGARGAVGGWVGEWGAEAATGCSRNPQQQYTSSGTSTSSNSRNSDMLYVWLSTCAI